MMRELAPKQTLFWVEKALSEYVTMAASQSVRSLQPESQATATDMITELHAYVVV